MENIVTITMLQCILDSMVKEGTTSIALLDLTSRLTQMIDNESQKATDMRHNTARDNDITNNLSNINHNSSFRFVYPSSHPDSRPGVHSSSVTDGHSDRHRDKSHQAEKKVSTISSGISSANASPMNTPTFGTTPMSIDSIYTSPFSFSAAAFVNTLAGEQSSSKINQDSTHNVIHATESIPKDTNFQDNPSTNNIAQDSNENIHSAVDNLTLNMRRSSISNEDSVADIQGSFVSFAIGSNTTKKKKGRPTASRPTAQQAASSPPTSSEQMSVKENSTIPENMSVFQTNFSSANERSSKPEVAQVFVLHTDSSSMNGNEANSIHPKNIDEQSDILYSDMKDQMKDNITSAETISTDRDNLPDTDNGVNIPLGVSFTASSQGSSEKSSDKTQDDSPQFNIGVRHEPYRVPKRSIHFRKFRSQKKSEGSKMSERFDQSSDQASDTDDKQQEKESRDIDIDWKSDMMQEFMNMDISSSKTTSNETKATPTASESQQDMSDNIHGKMEILAEMYRKQGRELYDEEEYESALDAFIKALQQAPPAWSPTVSVLGNQAASLMMLGRLTEAVDVCNKAISIDPNAVKIYCRQGRALIRLGYLSSATASFQAALEISSAFKPGQTNTSSDKKSFDEAMKHLDIINSLNKLLLALSAKESSDEYYGILHITDELLKTCTHFRVAQVARIRALIKLKRWLEAKDFIEQVTVSLPRSMHLIYAHESIYESLKESESNSSPIIKKTALQWYEDHNSQVIINIMNIVHACLCMGSEVAELYIRVLKNQEICRNRSTEVMNHLKKIFIELKSSMKINDPVTASSPRNDSSDSVWPWIKTNSSKLERLMTHKAAGDYSFRAGKYGPASASYGIALEADSEAFVWNAILLSNRAASYMHLHQYTHALNDCNLALRFDESYEKARLRRARVYRGMNEFEKSCEDYRDYLAALKESHASSKDLSKAKERKEIELELDEVLRMIDEKRRNASKKTSTSSYESKSAGSNQKPWNASELESDDDDWEEFLGMKSEYSNSSHRSKQSMHRDQKFNQRPNSSSSSKSTSSSHDGSFFNYSNDQRKYGSSSGQRYPSSSSGSNTYGSFPNSHSAKNPSSSSGEIPKFYSQRGSSFHHREKSKPMQPSQPEEPDYYKVLNVQSKATDREITIAYRKLALLYHPDKNKDANAEEIFKNVTSAYAVLSDKTSRYRYDLSRPY